MNKNNLFYICFISILLFSCSSVKLKNGISNYNPNAKIENVKIIAENEKLIHNGKKVGEFVLREDLKLDWNSLKGKIEEFAKLNGGNLIEIKTIGWGKKGNGFYADGNLFFVENINDVNSKTDENCQVFIIRDNLESVIGSAFTIDLKINETEFKNLTRNAVVKKEFIDCTQNVDIYVNGKVNSIKLNGESRYFKVGKQTNGNSIGGGISIGIGGVSLIEIEDKQIGKLIIYQRE